MDIAKLEERISLINRLIDELFDKYSNFLKSAESWDRVKLLPKDQLKKEKDDDDSSHMEDEDYLAMAEYNAAVSRLEAEEYLTRVKMLKEQHIKCYEMIQNEIEKRKRGEVQAETKEFEHEIAKRVFNALKKDHPDWTMEEGIFKTAELLQKTPEAVKRAIYYVGKLSKKLRTK